MHRRDESRAWPPVFDVERDLAAASPVRLSPGRRRRQLSSMTSFELRAIGRVESPLTDTANAPRQPDEGAPPATLVFHDEMLVALADLRAGDEVLLFTWLDRARRDVLRVHPRGDTTRPQEGVFSTRSPHRPNPIGLHRVEITSIDGARVQVRSLEAIDGTPILDVKPLLGEVSER
jgi:tRNA-Thr(GGU) m(6)t(6)A37 methyltransferase TsaA